MQNVFFCNKIKYLLKLNLSIKTKSPILRSLLKERPFRTVEIIEGRRTVQFPPWRRSRTVIKWNLANCSLRSWEGPRSPRRVSRDRWVSLAQTSHISSTERSGQRSGPRDIIEVSDNRNIILNILLWISNIKKNLLNVNFVSTKMFDNQRTVAAQKILADE